MRRGRTRNVVFLLTQCEAQYANTTAYNMELVILPH